MGACNRNLGFFRSIVDKNSILFDDVNPDTFLEINAIEIKDKLERDSKAKEDWNSTVHSECIVYQDPIELISSDEDEFDARCRTSLVLNLSETRNLTHESWHEDLDSELEPDLFSEN